MKKICAVTGNRAEYGLLRWVMDGINNSELLELNVIATGMHLLPDYGLTFNILKKMDLRLIKKLKCFSVQILQLVYQNQWEGGVLVMKLLI